MGCVRLLGHPLSPFSPQHSRPASQAELTLDSVCSLPWLRSTELGPGRGGPHFSTLLPAPLASQRKEQFKYKSVLDTNRTSRASEPSPELSESPGSLSASANKQRLAQ